MLITSKNQEAAAKAKQTAISLNSNSCIPVESDGQESCSESPLPIHTTFSSSSYTNAPENIEVSKRFALQTPSLRTGQDCRVVQRASCHGKRRLTAECARQASTYSTLPTVECTIQPIVLYCNVWSTYFNCVTGLVKNSKK